MFSRVETAPVLTTEAVSVGPLFACDEIVRLR